MSDRPWRCFPGPIRIAKKFITLPPALASSANMSHAPSDRRRDDAPELIHEPLRDPFPILLAPHRFGVDLLHKKRPHGPVEPPVRLAVVRAVKPGTEPRRFGKRDAREGVGRGRLDTLCLTAYGADLEARVLWSEEDLVTVETKEDVGRVLAGWWSCGRGGVTMSEFRGRMTYRRRARRARWHRRDEGLRTEKGHRLWRR